MSRRNRNNRYNSRSRNKWDEGYDDEYFDDDDQLESEEEDSSEDQDEYEEDQYEEYEDEDSDEEDPDEEDYDEDEECDEEEEYDEDESEDEEEYEDDEQEYDEDEYDEEEVDEEEEEDESEDDEDDELDSEIEAAAESTAKKSIGNSDLLSKLRGQMRPQLKEDQPESSKDVEINVSPLSLFGQPISQNNKKNASSVPPQHANARIVQTAAVGSKSPQSTPNASVQKSGSGRVITAQSQNGASVTSVQPRDLEAEKAEAEKKQKEKERLEQEQKTKAEKSARILDKFKRKKSSGESAVSKTKAGAAWLWSKISSGAAWIWTGIASGFLWIVLTPKRAWQTWRIFNASWWSGLGSGVWNAIKKTFVKKPVESAAAEGAEAVPSGSADASVGAVTSEPATVRKRKSLKKNVDIWDADATPGAEAGRDAFVSKEPDSRRRLYFSLSSIGAAAIVFLLVLPSLLNGSKKSDQNAVALNGQQTVSDVANPDVNKPVSEALPASGNGLKNNNQGIVNNNETSPVRAFNSPNGDVQTGDPAGRTPSTNGNAFNSPRGDMRTGYPGTNAPSNFNATSYPSRPNNQILTDSFELPAPDIPAQDAAVDEVPDLSMDVPELPAPEVSTPEVPDLSMDVPEIAAPEVTAPEVTDLGVDDSELAAPEAPTPEVTDLGLDNSLPTPELPSGDDVPVPDDVSDVPVPDLSDSELEAPSVDLQTPDIPDVTTQGAKLPASNREPTPSAGEDPFKGVTPDFSENSDVTAPAEVDLAPTPDLTSAVEPPVQTTDLQTPDVDVPDASMPELSHMQLVDSKPEEEPTVPEPTVPEPTVPEPTVPEPTVPEPTVPEPTVPEPTVPEPTVPEPTVPELPEPNALETGVASELTQPPVLEPQAPLTPEGNLPNDSQVVVSPTETPLSPPADSSVELGAPGPLVSSSNGNAADAKAQTAANVASSAVNNAPSTDAGYGTSEYNNSYANNYNSVPEYSQTYVNTGSYTVQPNDSFWTIAKRVYGSGEYARALAQYNSPQVSPQTLTVSVQIRTPPAETLERQFPGLCPSGALTSSAAPTANAAPAGTRVYIVDQEESVMEIARRELGSILYCSQVYALNQELLSGSVDRVKPGVRLLLPVKN